MTRLSSGQKILVRSENSKGISEWIPATVKRQIDNWVFVESSCSVTYFSTLDIKTIDYPIVTDECNCSSCS